MFKFNYAEIKLLLYRFQGMLGLIMIFGSWRFMNESSDAIEPVTYWFPGVILLVMGTICTLMALETYFLRDDPDVWR